MSEVLFTLKLLESQFHNDVAPLMVTAPGTDAAESSRRGTWIPHNGSQAPCHTQPRK